MKQKLIIAFLLSMLALTACNENETVSGEMTYHKGYEMPAFSYGGIPGSNCEALMNTVQKGVAARSQNYNKEWKVSFSGSSEDSALASADQEAVADFDAAVESLRDWHRQFEETKAANDIGKGSFSITYIVRVWRNKILKESEPIVFEYEYQK